MNGGKIFVRLFKVSCKMTVRWLCDDYMIIVRWLKDYHILIEQKLVRKL
jgi:hypothetical protein